MKALTVISVSLTASLAAGMAHASSPPTLYTVEQAKVGANAYAQNCAMCHGADLKGGVGPALAGRSFVAGRGATIGGVFAAVSQQMPATDPGGLSHAQYEAIMAYILQKNGYPAGATPINYDKAMKDAVPLVFQGK